MRVHPPRHRPAVRRALPAPGHGSWYFAVQVTTAGGRKAGYRRGGFPAREVAVAARRALLDAPAGQAAAGARTLARWLRYWLKLAEPSLRPSTMHGYRDHIDRYLIPGLGRVTLADLTPRRLHACFDLLAGQRTAKGTPVAASTVDRVRATLRSALNAAVRHRHHRRHLYQRAARDRPSRCPGHCRHDHAGARSVPGARLGDGPVTHIPVAATASGYCQM